jgi:murein DD-endopeptidase MepM/ murein hydrolase activator NlpD
MQPGSIKVKKGDQVTAGQELGRVGNSGNTSWPHLHVHLQDTPRLHLGEGIPIYFRNYRSNGNVIERGMPNGGMSWGEVVGEIVEHVGDDHASPSAPPESGRE